MMTKAQALELVSKCYAPDDTAMDYLLDLILDNEDYSKPYDNNAVYANAERLAAEIRAERTATYLILHSQHAGALDMPWQVIRCNYANDSQTILFDGPRDEAKAYLAANWDSTT